MSHFRAQSSGAALPHQRTGYITLREAITRTATKRTPDADVRRYLFVGYPGVPSETAPFRPLRWSDFPPDLDPFLSPVRATGKRLDAWVALRSARAELQHAFSEGILQVSYRDAAGCVCDVPASDWHNHKGSGLIATGTVGGFPVRDDPAYVAEAPFTDWLFTRRLGVAVPKGEPSALPSALTLVQAVAWIMLRDPETVGHSALNCARLEAAWLRTGRGADFAGALEEMLDNLREQLLPAFSRSGEGDRPVSARSWCSMVLVPTSDGQAIAGVEVHTPACGSVGTPSRILVHRDKVLSLWPPAIVDRALQTSVRAVAVSSVSQDREMPDRLATTWIPAAAAVFRLAFGMRGEPIQMGHKWGVPPDRWAVDALAARAAMQPWRPVEAPPRPAYIYRAAVRKLMRESEAARPGDGNPSVLLRFACEVTAYHSAWQAAVKDAEYRLTGAVRDGDVSALGIEVNSDDIGYNSSILIDIPPTVLKDVSQVINLRGELGLREDGDQPGTDSISKRFVSVHVDANALRRWHPSIPLPLATDMTPWDAMVWRAFGAVTWLNLGSRPDRLDEPPFFETLDHHALRIGVWTALEIAETELKFLLRTEQLSAYGRREAIDSDGQPAFRADGFHVPIPAETFLNRRLAFDQAGRLYERLTGDRITVQNGRPVPRLPFYFDLRIKTSEIAGVWTENLSVLLTNQEPVVSETEMIKPTLSPSFKNVWSKGAQGAWFMLRVNGWPHQSAYPSEKEDYAAACAWFEEVPRDKFREIRRDKTPPEWRRSGPRRPRN